MAKTTQQKLSELGYTMQEANEYVMAMVGQGQAQALAHKVASIGLNAQDLAQIVNAPKQEVIDFFQYSGVDTNLLNADKTNLVLMLDFTDTLWIHNPLTNQKKMLTDRIMVWTDVASDINGDVYLNSATLGLDHLWRYDISTGQLVDTGNKLAVGDNWAQGIEFYGDTLVWSAGENDGTLYLADRNGVTHSSVKVAPVVQGKVNVTSELAIANDKLYRIENIDADNKSYVTEYDILTGATKVLMANTDTMLDFDSVAVTDEWVIGYRDSRVFGGMAYNIKTHEVMKIDSPITSAGNSVIGTAPLLQSQVDLWGLPT